MIAMQDVNSCYCTIRSESYASVLHANVPDSVRSRFIIFKSMTSTHHLLLDHRTQVVGTYECLMCTSPVYIVYFKTINNIYRECALLSTHGNQLLGSCGSD